ncbi:SDR family NAD(P)-dependent oxidoreductase [Parafrankia sp. BMG5.11]|uniref:SDR family NAD(P)-dependent oxidoreductase n=1 Tax=Parafrankia sp. BMG5.11 TaxID=222540 RepID=UPI000DA49DBD
MTGANRGLGREIARQLAARGHDVLVGSRDPAAGERTAVECPGETTGTAVPPATRAAAPQAP